LGVACIHIFASKATAPDLRPGHSTMRGRVVINVRRRTPIPCLDGLQDVYDRCMAVGRGQRRRHLRDGRDGNNHASRREYWQVLSRPHLYFTRASA
jgi:hypothetical protein